MVDPGSIGRIDPGSDGLKPSGALRSVLVAKDSTGHHAFCPLVNSMVKKVSMVKKESMVEKESI